MSGQGDRIGKNSERKCVISENCFLSHQNNFLVGLKLHPERFSSVAKNWLPLAITSEQGAMRDTQKVTCP